MNFLVLSAWFPFPPDNGSKIRTHYLLRALAAQHTVDLACFYQNEREAGAIEQTREMCRQVAAFPKPKFDAEKAPSLIDLFSAQPRFLRTTYCCELAQKIHEWREQADYDAVVCMTWGMTPYVGSHFNARNSNGRVKGILDQHNIESGIFWRGLALKPYAARLRSRLTYEKFRRFEGRACTRFSICSVVSEPEKKELQRILPSTEQPRIEIVPNGVDTAAFLPRAPRPVHRNLLFTGTLSYGANVDGLRWFLRAIYPKLKARFPDIFLYVCGENEGRIPEAVNDPSIAFTGYLEDLQPLLQESAALVVPLRLGGGTRLKILQAMASGLPVVSTAIGAEGLEVTPGRHLLVADKAEDFAATVTQLLNRPGAYLSMTEQARRLVEEKYDWNSIGGKFVNLAEEVAKE